MRCKSYNYINIIRDFMKFNAKMTGVALAALLCVQAHASTISTSKGSSSYSIDYYALAQSFTAQDARVNFAFNYTVFSSAANTPLALKLYAGNGVNGNLLGTFSFVVQQAGFFDVDISTVNLVVGQSYTAALSDPSHNNHWGAYWSNDQYAGGTGYVGGTAQAVDLSFRVSPTRAAVPEPGSLAIFGLGLTLFAAARRRKTAA